MVRKTLAAALVIAAVSFAAVGARTTSTVTAAAAATTTCQLDKGPVKHVVYIVFDNTHYRRDRPNVPSDLEQMPHLLNFIRGNGTLLTNDHTVLI